MGDARLASFFAKFESDDLGLGLPPMLKPTTAGKKEWKYLDVSAAASISRKTDGLKLTMAR